MFEPSGAELTAELVLRYYRGTSRFRAGMLRDPAPPVDAQLILRLALGHPHMFADPALNEPRAAAELRHACGYFVRRMFFRPSASPYHILGLAPSASPEAIKESFRLMMQLVHPDRQETRAKWPATFATQATEAYRTLRNPESRAAYDREVADSEATHRTARRATAMAKMPIPPRGAPLAPVKKRNGAPSILERATRQIALFVRAHPGTSALLAMVTGSLLTATFVIREGREFGLVQEPGERAVAWRPAMPPVVVASVGDTFVGPASAGLDNPVRLKPDLQGTRGAEYFGGPASAGQERAARLNLVPQDLPKDFPQARPPASIEESPRAPTLPAAAGVDLPAPEDIDALLDIYVRAYWAGMPEVYAALFDENADANARRGRAAIRDGYEELLRKTKWRQMSISQIRTKRVGDRALVEGFVADYVGWRDGGEAVQRFAVEMEIVKRDGRTMIAKMSQVPLR